MTPEQKIKREILIETRESCVDASEREFWEELGEISELDSAGVQEAYDYIDGEGWTGDIEYAFREGTFNTDLPCDWSRHYESKSVACKLSDGSWVGWTYWFGGGKHGEPGAIEWMGAAYNLDVEEKQEVVTVRKFKKIE